MKIFPLCNQADGRSVMRWLSVGWLLHLWQCTSAFPWHKDLTFAQPMQALRKHRYPIFIFKRIVKSKLLLCRNFWTSLTIMSSLTYPRLRHENFTWNIKRMLGEVTYLPGVVNPVPSGNTKTPMSIKLTADLGMVQRELNRRQLAFYKLKI